MSSWNTAGALRSAKRHPQELKLALMTYEHHLGNIFWVHWDLIISLGSIKFGDHSTFAYMLEDLLDSRHVEQQGGGNSIDGFEINAQPCHPVGLPDGHHR